jgi:hypothetical protein
MEALSAVFGGMVVSNRDALKRWGVDHLNGRFEGTPPFKGLTTDLALGLLEWCPSSIEHRRSCADFM